MAPSMARRMGRRLSLLLLVAALPLVLWAVLPLGSSGQSADSLQRQIDRKRAQIDQKRGRERVLTTEVSAYTHKIGDLQADITVLQTRQVRLEANLEAKRAELAQIQEDLRRERLRLARPRCEGGDAGDRRASGPAREASREAGRGDRGRGRRGGRGQG